MAVTNSDQKSNLINSVSKQHPFSLLTDEQRSLLFEKADIVRFPVGHLLLRPDEISSYLYLIISGEVRFLTIDPFDRQICTIAKKGAGQLLGWLSIFSRQPCEHVSASQEAVVLRLDVKVFSELLIENKNFLGNFLELPSPFEVSNALQFLIKENENKQDALTTNFKDICADFLVRSFGPGEHVFERNLSREYKWFADFFTIDGSKQVKEITDEYRFPEVMPYKLPTRVLGIPCKYLEPGSTYLKAKTSQPQYPVGKTRPVDIESLDILSNDLPEEDDKYPFISGRDTVSVFDAICEMICISKNTPYRRDIVINILKSKIKRSKDITIEALGSLLELLGFQVMISRVQTQFVSSLEFPVAYFDDTDSPKIIFDCKKDVLCVADPRDCIENISLSKFIEEVGDELVFVSPQTISTTPIKTFGWNWFVPLLGKYKLSLILVFIASLFAQLFGLAIPLLIQQIIDKVLTQGNLSSLNILGTTMIVLAIFQGLLTALRTYIFVDTTDRIDLTLGSAVIARLLSLRLNFFEKRPVGELSQRLGELNNIRSFLTGTALSSVLNILFASLYLVVMIIYSPLLTAVALSTIPIYVLMIIFVAPLYRSLIRRRAVAQAQTQSHLIEVLSGIQTVKAQNFEVTARWKWQERYQTFIDEGFKSVVLGTSTGVVGGFLNTLSGLLILWVGMWLVLDGQMTLGMLIAFRIISGNVVGPITQLATLYQGFQKVQLSMERVSDIVDQVPEYNLNPGSKFGQISLPPVQGNIVFEDVSFKFDGAKKNALENIDLVINKSQFVAIVGQSGSGKSTLTKMIAKLYEPSKGVSL